MSEVFVDEKEEETTPDAIPPKWIIRKGSWHPVCGNRIGTTTIFGPATADCAYELQRGWYHCPFCGMGIDWSQTISWNVQDEIDQEESEDDED